MNNLAIVEVEEMSDVETPKPVLAYTRGARFCEENAQLVESIVDCLLANGGMPA